MNKIQKYIMLVAFLVIIGMIIFGIISENKNKDDDTTVINSENLPGIQIGNIPWISETENLQSRLAIIGLPALTEEGEVLHTHQHLDIFINGKLIPIPAEIGVNEPKRFISSIHTHDEDSIIHIESPTIQKFYLGQFFDIWGVRFNKDCIGGYCANNENSLKVFINGEEIIKDPRLIELLAHQEIVITYGKDSEMPNPIPKTYIFGPNL